MFYKKSFFFLIMFCCFITAEGQFMVPPADDKTVIDSNSFGEWPFLSCKVSNDARFACFYIRQNKGLGILTVEKLANGKKVQISNFNESVQPTFSKDSRKLIFIKGKDTLCLL